MRINLAKVVPWLGVALIAVLWVFAKSGGAAEQSIDDPYRASAYGDSTRADAYLDQVAAQLAQPGVYVDPAVEELSVEDQQRLDAAAKDTAGPLRVAVIPADALREDDPSADPYGYNPMPYSADETVGQLYDRVGVDGTYAILVDADSSDDGRSFTAYQYAEERPYYDVEGALDDAVDCCAPDYDSMLTTFVAGAGDEKVNPLPIILWSLGGVVALVLLLVGGRAFLRRRKHKREDAQVADALRPSLQEEVIELEHTVSSLPTPPASTDASLVPVGVDQRTRTVLDLVEEARHRLDATEGDVRMDTPDEVEQVVRRLSDARYELVAIDALRNGRPVPERTAPCFFDPRHGPSVEERPFTPQYGAARPVPVCAKCRDEIDAGQVPEPRELVLTGSLPKPYWDWDRFSRPYVNGYWQRYTFADDRVQRIRTGASPVLARSGSGGGSGGGLQFVWESGNDSGGGGSFWGSGGSSGSSSRRSFSGRSSSRRSFGGGSSRRSHSRSGGSRKF